MWVNAFSAGLAIWMNTLCDLVSVMVEHGMMVLVMDTILLRLIGVGKLNVLAICVCSSAALLSASAEHVAFSGPMALCLCGIGVPCKQYCVQ